VFRNAGYDATGSYPSVPADGFADFDPAASPQVLVNPWEIVWADNVSLFPAAPALAGPGSPGARSMHHPGDLFWLEEQWQEGGFATAQLADFSGDGMPDQVQHIPSVPPFPNLEGSLVDALLPHVDNSSAPGSDVRLHIRYNRGAFGWSPQVLGPVDPVSLYETRDAQVPVDCDGGGVPDDLPDDCVNSTPELLEQLAAVQATGLDPGTTEFCAALGSGAFDECWTPSAALVCEEGR
jgi:hypothetical protein